MDKAWWWLSFADGTLPEGSQFLGAAFVQGYTMIDAVQEAWRLGVNPGGEVVSQMFPADNPPAEHLRNRLLSKAELESEFDDLVQCSPYDFASR